MKIVYKPHLLIRLKEREFPQEYPRRVIQFPDQEYFDTFAKRYIAIKQLSFAGRLRNIVVAYDIIKESKEVITIHVISSKEIKNKLNSGRWRLYEKKSN